MTATARAALTRSAAAAAATCLWTELPRCVHVDQDVWRRGAGGDAGLGTYNFTCTRSISVSAWRDTQARAHACTQSRGLVSQLHCAHTPSRADL
jgi:hypothetical protein